MSDHRASDRLERKLSELSPKLDDLYIRVLPVMSEIKATLKRDETMEHNIVREVQSCQHKLEEVFEKIEDIAEAQPVINNKPVDPRLERDRHHYDNDSVIIKMGMLEENITRLQGNVQECVNALIEMRTFSAKQSTVDKIEKTLNQQREDSVFGSDLSGSSSENLGRVLRRVETLLDFSKKQEKSMAAFMKNADSDAKTLSQCNTAIQGMKSAVTANGREVLLAISAITDQVRPLEVAFEEVNRDMANFGGTLDEIKTQVRNMDQDSDVGENIQRCLEKLSAVTNSLKVDGKAVTLEASGGKGDGNVVESKADFKPIIETINKNNLKVTETLSLSFASMKEVMQKNNKGMGKAIGSVLTLLTETVDHQKETNAKLENMESNLIPTIKELVPDLKEVILQSGDSYENASKIENIGTRIQKLHAVVTRVKHLLEAGSDDEDDVKRRRKNVNREGESDGELSSLLRDVKEKLSDRSDVFTRLDCIVEKMEKNGSGPESRKIEGSSLKIGQLEEAVSESISRRIEEDLSKNEEKIDRVQELVQEVKNIVAEVGERMITNKSFSNSQTDIRQQISSLEKSISHLPDEISHHVSSMEESLCSNVETSVRDVIKSPMDHVTDEVEGISNKLNELKRIVSLSEHDEDSDQPTLGSLVARINEVAEKLSIVHGALENRALSQNGSHDGSGDKLGTALVLEELRKKPDITLISSLRKEVSSAVVNQSRVIEEQLKQINKRDIPVSSTSTPLIECLNKVRESQNLITSTQNRGLTSQERTNKILLSVVQSLDATNELLEKFDRAHNKIAITAKLSETVDDLGSHTASLMTAQDQLASYCTESINKTDQLIKTATTIMREDTWNSKKRLAISRDEGPASKRRSASSGVSLVVNVRDIPGSPASASEDWEAASEVRQPTVKVRQVQVSPEQRAELLRTLEAPEEESDELRDEFASPEKM